MPKPDNYPHIIPTQKDMAGVFERYSFNDLRDAKIRRLYIGQKFPEQSKYLLDTLHEYLTSVSATNHRSYSGRQVGVNHGLAIHGLDKWLDFREVILPVLADELYEIATDAKVDDDQALSVMSELIPTIIAESQMYSDGNHRISKALEQFVLTGPYMDMEYILESPRSFHPSFANECLILHQNTARLMDEQDGGEYTIQGGIYVNPSIPRSIESVQAALDHEVDLLAQAYADRNEQPYNKYMRDIVLGEIAGEADRDFEPQIQTILHLGSYGAAAYVASLGEKEFSSPLTRDDAAELYKADRKLHIMRQMSLMGGVIGKGFVEIGEDRSINVRPWK